ncbi:restriction system-associated AAA family ATPase [Maribacter polysiphoniae]|uniref:Restriction system-associated AAA family ATPase n=1 Tax=Maribacter polysiphoniae TaxID=429344 RepID=A0A316DY45_9FLAO|nr:restriction system-associated AAA family ATPase [Maribacter polysiphoniae]MBD1261513.1 restriction system-associated AAA family ATPase [Maribacter polysiphoniae]PWK22845.1 restriction system-associated AAA family ATPase [Maribacter polysiphoniae]
MKLKRIKLLSPFRGLPADYEINFNRSLVANEQIEPICFVGLNGSGKSNALEVVAEMFYYLENFNRSSKKDLDNFKTAFGFELDYYLPKLTLAGAGFTWDELGALTFDDLDQNQLVLVSKPVDELPAVKLSFNEKEIEVKDFYNNGLSKVLPNHIIGYSSGLNELVSNPFVKLNFEYYEDLKRKKNKAVDSKLEMNRFQFLNYNVSKLITVSNFIFDKELSLLGETKDLSILKTEIEVNELNGFSIQLSLKKPKTFEKYLPDELEEAIESFKAIDALFDEENNSTTRHDFTNLSFNFKMNEATLTGFREKFNSADRLFRVLYFFQTLNIEKISRNISKTVKSAKAGTSENLSDLIPKYEIEKQLFHLGNISFKKEGVTAPIYYKHLSDGEHQLLQVLGSIILLDSTSTLFLLDEPETHFNPEWRSKFIWLINACMKANPTEDDREQEIVLTTHSPFMISDSKKSNVVWLKADKRDGPEEVTINTYGTSVTNLINEFFGKQRQIADVSWKEMLEDLKSNNINELNDALSKYGDSHEKTMILQKLNKLIIEKGTEE